MKYKYLLPMLFCFVAACNNESSQEQVSNDTNSKKPAAAEEPAAQSSCYEQATDKDTVTLRLRRSETNVNGELKYDLFEKDANTGTITGRFSGDTLLAEYHFHSEGQTSVRQVAFLKKGDDYIEGFGDVIEKDGKMIFKPGAKLVFSDSLRLKKVDCGD